MTYVFSGVSTGLLEGPGSVMRRSVRAASTANVNLAADLNSSTLDGITIVTGDRILLKNQTTASQNGLYDVGNGAGASTRTTDYTTGIEATTTIIAVEVGTTNASTTWICTNPRATSIVGTDNLVYAQATGTGVNGDVTTTGAQTLTNKSLVDSNTFIVDDVDSTKRMQFQASGITTATTRTLTIPNASDTIAVLDLAQTFTNKTFASGSGTTIDASLITAGTLPVARGGTGATTHTAGNILRGNGTSAITSTLAAPTGAIVGTTDTQTLTNKSLVDATTSIVDDADNTKVLQFQCSGITTGTTRILTVPNASDTIAVLTAAQTLTNKTFAAGSGTTIDASLITTGTLPVARGGTGATTHTAGNILQGNGTSAITSTLVAPTGAIVGTTDTQTLTNKTFIDASTSFVDDVDNTKVLQFQCGTIGTGTTRTITIPNSNGIMVILAAPQILRNKSLVDATTFFIDGTDESKIMQLQCSGITTATTRTLSVPDLDGTIALLEPAQTFTNKTITDSTNNVTANALRSATTTVSVSGATAPTTGQVLTATSSTAATWQTLTAGDVTTTGTQTLTNKSLVDASTFIIDDGDNTKRLQLQCSGITTGTTRTLTVPNASDTIAVLATAQTLTNKTITDSTNNVTARNLRSATTDVACNGTTPTADAVLTAISTTAASWVVPLGGRYQTTSSTGSSTNSTTTFNTKVSHATSNSNPAGNYMVQWTAMAAITNVISNSVEYRIVINGTTYVTSVMRLANASPKESRWFTGHTIATFTAGSKTITMDWRTQNTSTPALISHAHITTYYVSP